MRLRTFIILVVVSVIAGIVINDYNQHERSKGGYSSEESEISEIDKAIIATVRKKCPNLDDQIITDVVLQYQRNAEAFARRWGEPGIILLHDLGAAGLEVGYEHEEAFSRCLPYLAPSTAGDFILSYAKIGKDLIENGSLEFLLKRVHKLTKKQRGIAQKHPQIWPFMLCAPEHVEKAMNSRSEICMKTFFFLDLSRGPEDLINLCEMIIKAGNGGQRFARSGGLDGLLLHTEFPQLYSKLSANARDELAIIIGILKTNIESARYIVAKYGLNRLAYSINKMVEADLQCRRPLAGFEQKRPYGQVYNAALNSPKVLRLIADYGPNGILVVKRYGSMGSDIFHMHYAHDQRLFEPLMEALTLHSDYSADLNFSVAMFFADNGAYHNDFCEAINTAYTKREQKEWHWLNIFPAVYKDLDNPSQFFELFKKQPSTVLNIEELDLMDSAREAIPGHDSWVVIDVLLHGEIPTTGQLVWAGIDVGFIVWDVITAIPSGGTGPVAAEGMRVAAKTGTKQAIKKSVIIIKGLRECSDDAIKAGVNLVQGGGKAKGIETVSTILHSNKGDFGNVMGTLMKKGWSPDMSFAKLARKGKSSMSINTLSNSQKKFLSRLSKNFIFDWTVGVLVIEGIKSDAVQFSLRKIKMLTKEAAQASQIHLEQAATWLMLS